jgi:hypothetical protein
MEVDVINVFWTFIGLLIWPELTLCIILWSLGHPILGIIALFTTFGSATTVIKEKYIDSNGTVVKTKTYEQ